jgi:hypothetical protein
MKEEAMDCTLRNWLWMWFAVAATATNALAQYSEGQPAEPPQQFAPPQQANAQPQPTAIVATVNGEPITKQEVEASLQPHLQGQQVDPQALQQMQQQIVNQLVEVRLVEQYMAKSGPAVEKQEVTAVVEQVKTELAAQQIPMDQFLATRGQTEESFKKRVEGSLAWQKFQQQEITGDKLAQFFHENQDKFQAETLEQARDEVAGVYAGELWRSIIGQMIPNAKIETPASQVPQQPAAPALAPQ